MNSVTVCEFKSSKRTGGSEGELCVSSDWTVCPPGLSPSLMLKLKRGVFADVGGINGSSSSVNMNRIWHLVRSFLLSEGGEVVHAQGFGTGPGPWVLCWVVRKKKQQLQTDTWIHRYMWLQTAFNLNQHHHCDQCLVNQSSVEQLFDFCSLLHFIFLCLTRFTPGSCSV